MNVHLGNFLTYRQKGLSAERYLDARLIFTFTHAKITSDRQIQYNFGIFQLVRQLKDFPLTQHRLHLLIPMNTSSKNYFSEMKEKGFSRGSKLVKSYWLKRIKSSQRFFPHRSKIK